MLIKKLLVASVVLSLSSLANASFYVGAQGGSASVNPGKGLSNMARYLTSQVTPTYNFELISKRDISKGNFGGRIYIGFKYNKFLSIESGFSAYENNNYSAKFLGGGIDTNQYKLHIRYAKMNAKTQTQSVDITGKLNLPLQIISPRLSKFNLYGKIGAAYVMSKINFCMNYWEFIYTPINLIHKHYNIKHTNRSWAPTYGLGISYDINKNIGMDFAWSGVLGKHKISSNKYNISNLTRFIPTINLYSIGIYFKF